ncbi:hypothetical protein PR001_g17570 [Phytophthora rubi]|uniref:Uncharacterized protein n=1 Tax=Phytophthora rubi TaxID=129364 RepID=A0A6A3KEP9_9STRA|nr:hypothetical protein PR001_g17570 [Phytophthora rubi]
MEDIDLEEDTEQFHSKTKSNVEDTEQRLVVLRLSKII